MGSVSLAIGPRIFQRGVSIQLVEEMASQPVINTNT